MFSSFSDVQQFVLMAGLALGGLAVMLFVYMLLSEQESLSTQDSLEELDGKRGNANPLFRVLKPFIRNYLVTAVKSKPKLEKYRVSYRRKIITAGLKNEITADEFIAFKIFLIVIFPLVGSILNAAKLLEFDQSFLAPLGAVGFFYPDLWIGGIIKRRHRAVLKSLPFVVDLLALSTEAGLDFMGAIQKVVEKAARSPLIEELEQVLKDIQLGQSRSTALREFSQRVNLKEVNSFVAVLIAAESMGASIGTVLRQQSEQVRIERFLRAEKEGGQAASKLIVPMVPILFAIMLIMGGSFFAEIMKAKVGGGP